MSLSVGAKLGPYLILEKVGVGGMGEVHKARDTRLGRIVALKTSREEFSERFAREARAAAALNHPNICQLYDVGPNYLVMEYVEGIPVGHVEDLQQLLDMATQMADALVAAQQTGIVHRDLKPGNIMVTRESRIKMLDFGLALMEHPEDFPVDGLETVATEAGTTVGTVAYMSPEQARGQLVDARSDLWSLGVVLYEMATGSRPFEGATSAMLFDQILNKPPVPVSQRNPKIPIALGRIVDRLLEKDREMRYQSAADVRADLKRVGRDSDPAKNAVPVSPPRRTTPKLMTVVAAAAILVVVAAGFVVWRGPTAAPLTDKDVLVLADFTNTTGDSVFDGTLREALSIQLSQSPFLMIMSDDRVSKTLQLMGRPVTERITNAIAREICQRRNEKAMIGGSIASLGKSYAITLQATNCQTGDSLAAAQSEAPDKEHVLKALSTAATAMRAGLGESLSSIQKLDRPVDEVTTSSLEALQVYAQGTTQFRQGAFLASIRLFQTAVERDPNFAMAWLYMGNAYLNAGTASGAEQRSKAYSLRDRVSERERLSITAFQDLGPGGDMYKGWDAVEAWVRTYPRDALPHFLLTFKYTFQGDPNRALKEAEEAVRLGSNATFVAALVGMYARLDRFAEALAIADKAVAENLDSVELHLNLLRIGYAQDDSAAVDREIRWFSNKPEEYGSFVAQAADTIAHGQLRRSEELFRRAAETARRHNLPIRDAFSPANSALTGNCPPESAAPLNVVVAALCGNPVRTLEAVEDQSRRGPNGTVMSVVTLPALRAAAELRRDQAARAIELLQPLASHELYSPQITYLRGLAYLQLGKGTAAAAEFRKIIDHKGIHWRFHSVFPEDTGALRPLSYLGLARAETLADNTAGARTAYQDFLALWKDADQDLPTLLEARKEYGALK